MKIIISLALLFSLAFASVHEYVFAFYDNDHCDTTEYVNELSGPSDHGDICDIHFEYHQTYILTSSNTLVLRDFLYSKLDFFKDNYTYENTLEFTKPPIS